MLDSLLNKERSKLSFKEEQTIANHFRNLLDIEFRCFKKKFLAKDKEEIFEKSRIINDYELIKINLESLNLLTIINLLKYQKENFIDYMYNSNVLQDDVEFCENIQNRIIKETSKLRLKNNNLKAA